MVPEDNPSEFVAKHLSAYEFIRERVKGAKLLEVGFGDGYGMGYLSSSAGEITGVDIAPENQDRAAKKYPSKNLRFMHFDGYRFPFEDGQFDAVCSFQVIEHIPEGRLLEWLSEIGRVLKSDGHFYVSTLNLAHAMKPGQPYEKNHDHEKEFIASELNALLRQAFPDVRMFGLQYTLKQRFFKRLKKWGWKNQGRIVTTADFRVSPENVHHSIDLIAVCGKNT